MQLVCRDHGLEAPLLLEVLQGHAGIGIPGGQQPVLQQKQQVAARGDSCGGLLILSTEGSHRPRAQQVTEAALQIQLAARRVIKKVLSMRTRPRTVQAVMKAAGVSAAALHGGGL